MPIRISSDGPTMLIRRQAFERAGLTRTGFDERFNLTADEFQMEGDLIVVGPLVGEMAFDGLIAELESVGLTHYDDFFDLTGNWPEWLAVVVQQARGARG